eukprot:scaffold3416_cov185-Amphora_coffeaeformis.AAC.4
MAPILASIQFAKCYDASSNDAMKQPHVIQSKGFDMLQIESSQIKRCWEGNKVNDTITFKVPASNEITLFVYKMVDGMGMVDVVIDGNETGIVIDAWYEGFWWLPSSRGHVFAVNVTPSSLAYKEHELSLIIRNVIHLMEVTGSKLVPLHAFEN